MGSWNLTSLKTKKLNKAKLIRATLNRDFYLAPPELVKARLRAMGVEYVSMLKPPQYQTYYNFINQFKRK